MSPADDRQDELLEDMVLALAVHHGFTIDPVGDDFNIDRLRLCACDMLDGTVPILRALPTSGG